MDSSQAGCKRGWRVMGRAVQGFLQATCYTKEVASLAEAPSCIHALVTSVAWPTPAGTVASCWRCRAPLAGTIGLACVDVDQAFESCSGDTVCSEWEVLSESALDQFSCDRVLVQRGKKVVTKYPSETYTSNYYGITFSMIFRALWAYCRVTLVSLGQVVCELRGLAIGGVFSGACVSVRLGGGGAPLLPWPASS